MDMSKEDAVKRARADLAKRLGVGESQVKEDSIERAEFPDTALGAGVEGEMSMQMISNGYRIRLSVGNDGYEYRANNLTVRLYKFDGENYRVV